MKGLNRHYECGQTRSVSDAPSQPRATLSDREEGIRGHRGGARAERVSPPPDKRRGIIKNYQMAFGWAFFSLFLKGRRPGLKEEGLRSN